MLNCRVIPFSIKSVGNQRTWNKWWLLLLLHIWTIFEAPLIMLKCTYMSTLFHNLCIRYLINQFTIYINLIYRLLLYNSLQYIFHLEFASYNGLFKSVLTIQVFYFSSFWYSSGSVVFCWQLLISSGLVSYFEYKGLPFLAFDSINCN